MKIYPASATVHPAKGSERTKGKIVIFKVPDFSTAYDMYIDRHLVAPNGKVATGKKGFSPEYRPEVVGFTPAGTSFEIMIHVANFTYARGGMWERWTSRTLTWSRSM